MWRRLLRPGPVLLERPLLSPGPAPVRQHLPGQRRRRLWAGCVPCPGPSNGNGSAQCVGGTCQIRCNDGFELEGDRCVRPDPGNFVVNGKSNLCLGVSGSRALQLGCDGSARWELRSLGGGAFNLINKNSGLCLGVPGGSVEDFVELGQFGCALGDPFNNQGWRFEDIGGGFDRIVNGKSGKCIGVSGGSIEIGAVVFQAPCDASPGNNQSWDVQ